MDGRTTECTSCRAVGTYERRSGPLSDDRGVILWRREGKTVEDLWDLSRRGYLPNLCVTCAGHRCWACGR